MRDKFSRRDFLKTGIGIGAASMLPSMKSLTGQEKRKGKMCVVSSRNGLRATEKAMEFLGQGKDPLDAVIAGVNIVESDPNDRSVGYGGLPNEEGVVELDSCVMHGPTHNGGAVASEKAPLGLLKLMVLKRKTSLQIGQEKPGSGGRKCSLTGTSGLHPNLRSPIKNWSLILPHTVLSTVVP
jgi:N4-(beta-N-acetylglucosaminyl)-L-asparaginase